jgi:hypothetical protein
MKPVNEMETGRSGVDSGPALAPGLAELLTRLEAFSIQPGFRSQRQIALKRALVPYTGDGQQSVLPATPEEIELAKLYVYADYFPEDGQLSLIEQVRDLVEVHVPQEERQWLDPVRHSYMDLLEVVAVKVENPNSGLHLRSLGDGHEFHVAPAALDGSVKPDQVLLTRLLRFGESAVLPGTAIVLTATNARAIKDACDQWRREVEIRSGDFDLADWSDFAKRYGHIILWKLADRRLNLLLQLEARVRHRNQDGSPFLYALALYEHQSSRLPGAALDELAGFEHEAVSCAQPPFQSLTRVQHMDSDEGRMVVARLTLSEHELLVECDSAERLESLKHLLASRFGYALHFQGETTTVPAHTLFAPELSEDEIPSLVMIVEADEEQRLLTEFLELVYLEWADRPSPVFDGQTPRHAAAVSANGAPVAAVIDEMERHDPAQRRIGKPGYDFDRLRAHVGLL